MFQDYSLPRLDTPCRRRADLAFHLARQHPRLAKVYPLDGLQVGHRQERAGPKEGYTLTNEHLRNIERPNVEG
jgi:hypothetical protein